MLQESAPNALLSIVMLEDAVRQLDLRTGNLHLKCVDEGIKQIARETFFSKNPFERYFKITTSLLFRQGVEKVKFEVRSRLLWNKDLQGEHPLTVPNIQKLMLFRFRLMQGLSHFEVRAGREILKIPLKDGFTALAARIIVNQLENYNKPSNDPREEFRQFGYYSKTH